MATNVTPAWFDSDVQAPKALHIEDLNEGDKLIQVSTDSYASDRFTENEWTVAKVLKSRLVLAREGNNGPVHVRVLVRNSKSWPRQNGQVERTLEGDGSSWASPSFDLYTPDEPSLVKRRAAHAAAVEERRVKKEAKEALDAFKAHLSVEKAEEAIAALQAWVANQRKSGA